jgi:hypothetical protein
VRVDIAVAVLTVKIRSWCSPLAWVWVAGRDVGGNSIAREEEDADACRRPFHGVDAAAVVVEWCAIGRCRTDDTAPDTRDTAQTAICVAFVAGAGLGCGRWVEAAITLGVEGHVVLRDVVKAFDDVDLAVVAVSVSDGPAVESLSIFPIMKR